MFFFLMLLLFLLLYRLYERSPLLLSDIPRLSDFFMTWHHYRKSGSPKKTIRCFCHPNRKSYRFSLYIILLFRFKTKRASMSDTLSHISYSFLEFQRTDRPIRENCIRKYKHAFRRIHQLHSTPFNTLRSAENQRHASSLSLYNSRRQNRPSAEHI